MTFAKKRGKIKIAPNGAGAVAKTAVSHSLAKGGDADGTRAMDESPSFSDLFSHDPLGHGLHSPKSVLTARRPPSG